MVKENTKQTFKIIYNAFCNRLFKFASFFASKQFTVIKTIANENLFSNLTVYRIISSDASRVLTCL